jgi:restriction-modification system family protein
MADPGGRGFRRLLEGLGAAGYGVARVEGGPLVDVELQDSRVGEPLALRVFLAGLGRESARPRYRRAVTPRGARLLLRDEPGRRTLLLGYEPELDVFAAWQAEAHPEPAPGASLRVPLGRRTKTALRRRRGRRGRRRGPPRC